MCVSVGLFACCVDVYVCVQARTDAGSVGGAVTGASVTSLSLLFSFICQSLRLSLLPPFFLSFFCMLPPPTLFCAPFFVAEAVRLLS